MPMPGLNPDAVLINPVLGVRPASRAARALMRHPRQCRILRFGRPREELVQRDTSRTAVGHAGRERRVPP